MDMNHSTEITRKNRKTGNLITLYGVDGQWFTICETHGAGSEHYTKSAAIDWMADPTVWCQGCHSESTH